MKGFIEVTSNDKKHLINVDSIAWVEPAWKTELDGEYIKSRDCRIHLKNGEGYISVIHSYEEIVKLISEAQM